VNIKTAAAAALALIALGEGAFLMQGVLRAWFAGVGR
jgi:hypothetical protein